MKYHNLILNFQEAFGLGQYRPLSPNMRLKSRQRLFSVHLNTARNRAMRLTDIDMMARTKEILFRNTVLNERTG